MSWRVGRRADGRTGERAGGRARGRAGELADGRAGPRTTMRRRGWRRIYFVVVDDSRTDSRGGSVLTVRDGLSFQCSKVRKNSRSVCMSATRFLDGRDGCGSVAPARADEQTSGRAFRRVSGRAGRRASELAEGGRTSRWASRSNGRLMSGGKQPVEL